MSEKIIFSQVYRDESLAKHPQRDRSGRDFYSKHSGFGRIEVARGSVGNHSNIVEFSICFEDIGDRQFTYARETQREAGWGYNPKVLNDLDLLSDTVELASAKLPAYITSLCFPSGKNLSLLV